MRANLSDEIQEITEGLLPNYKRHLENIAAFNATNATIICDYIRPVEAFEISVCEIEE